MHSSINVDVSCKINSMQKEPVLDGSVDTTSNCHRNMNFSKVTWSTTTGMLVSDSRFVWIYFKWSVFALPTQPRGKQGLPHAPLRAVWVCQDNQMMGRWWDAHIPSPGWENNCKGQYKGSVCTRAEWHPIFHILVFWSISQCNELKGRLQQRETKDRNVRKLQFLM